MTAPDTLTHALRQIPRVTLSHLPTPLEQLPTLADRLELPSLLIKRDDQTGLAFGGNKARKLDYMMADVANQRADAIVTWAGVQSNWCRQVAAAGARLRIKPVLILFQSPSSPKGDDGNLLLDRIFNADIRLRDAAKVENMMELRCVRPFIDEAVEELRAAGMSPYVAPIGGSHVEGSMTQPLGTVGYVNAFVEILEQAAEADVRFDTIVLATGSGGTQAGLLVGAKVLAPQVRIVGISVYAPRSTVSRYVREMAETTLEFLAQRVDLADEDIVVFDEYLADGYGVLNHSVAHSIQLMADSEGILLDPVYTGKAMAGLSDLRAKGLIRESETVLFLHTGGTPALFPYRRDILDHLC